MKNRDLLRLFVVIVFVFVVAIIPISVMAAPPQQGPSTYFVQPGDTLFSIAMRYGTNVPALMSANGLMSDYIYAGQRLILPAGYYPYGYNWYYRGYYPYYWGSSSIYAPQPLPTVQPIPNPTFICTYTVVSKDTVFSIAYRYHVSVPTLMQANNLFSPIIHVGQPLKVPCEVTPPPVTMYTVLPGENLLRIAIKFNTTIYALSLVNGIFNPNFVFAGQVLAIPYPGSYIWPTGIPGPLTPLPQTSVTPTPTTTPPPASFAIIMTNKAFVPGTITVNRGSTVLWQNNDPFTHTVTSGAPGAIDNKFKSGPLVQGQTFSFTFNDAGTFPYFSETDQNMAGNIVVQ